MPFHSIGTLWTVRKDRDKKYRGALRSTAVQKEKTPYTAHHVEAKLRNHVPQLQYFKNSAPALSFQGEATQL